MTAAKKREIRDMYIMGENPAMSDPDVDHAREAMAALDHMVVQASRSVHGYDAGTLQKLPCHSACGINSFQIFIDRR